MDVLKRIEAWLFPFATSGEQVVDLDTEALQSFESDVEKCPVCNIASVGNRVCGGCMQTPPHFEKTQTLYRLNDSLKAHIHHYKYGSELAYSRIFAELMAADFDVADMDALLPIPLHQTRLLERGFNQSLEIAKVLSTKTHIPLIKNTLLRSVATPFQTQLNREQRLKNLKNAFALAEELPANIKHIALVDDVITTGSTMNQAARVLKRRYPHLKIQAWAIAKAP